MSLSVLASITADMARELAVSNGVCVRPMLKRVLDRDTGIESRVPCGSTREAVCPPCARKARTLRMQQCAEGWHRDTEPDHLDQVTRSTSKTMRSQATRTRATSWKGRGGCGRRDADSMRRICPGHRCRLGLSGRHSPRLTASSTDPQCSSPSHCRPTDRSRTACR